MKIRLLIIISLFLSSFFNISQAQSEKEMLDFLHSGKVSANTETIKIPIKIYNDLILLKVKINGNDATFMWDNGFSFSGIDNNLIQSYKLLPYSTNGNLTATDGNNTQVNINLFICQNLDLKDIKIENTPFIKADFKAMTQSKKLVIDGILGASIINKLNWKFDFDNNFVEISQKPFSNNLNNLILPYRIIETNNNHIMPISLNNNNTETLVDFGYNNDDIEINTSNAKHFSKAEATKNFGPSSISLSGVAKIDTIYTISAGDNWELSGKKLNLSPKISFTNATNNVVIGNKFFRNNYNLIINTTGSTNYILTPRIKPIKDETEKSYGYSVNIVEDKLKIGKIISNPNSNNNIIKLMDEVISINGKKIGDFQDAYSLKLFQKNLLENNKSMILKFKNGESVTLKPKDNQKFKYRNDDELW